MNIPMLFSLEAFNGTDDDLAGTAIYLASRPADYVLGVTMTLCGGIGQATVSQRWMTSD